MLKLVIGSVIGLFWSLTAGGQVISAQGAPRLSEVVPVVGVVWDEPTDLLSAATDLRAIRASGFQAVRTAPLTNERLYELADTLGLSLYLDLPFRFMSAGQMVDTTRAAYRLMLPLLNVSARHRSVAGLGVVHVGATSDPAACEAMTDWATFGRRQAVRPILFYYTTWFSAREACGDAVDLVLVDRPLRNPMPEDLAAVSAERVGVASIGYLVDGAGRWRDEDAQARFFETHLPPIIAAASGPVFVYRWNAPTEQTADPVPLTYDYALHRADGASRRAAPLLEEMLADGRTMFSHPAPREMGSTGSGTILTGWLIFVMMLIITLFSPRFRGMIPRYFFAHGFFRQAVSEGRDTMIGINSLLLVTVGIIFGLTALQVIRFVPDLAVGHVLWEWSPVPIRSLIDGLFDRPLLFAIFAGALATVVLSFWMVLWGAAVSRNTRLGPGQALILMLWPRWTSLALLPVIMVISTLPHDDARLPMLFVAAAMVLGEAWATMRTNIDLGRISRASPVLSLVLWLISPIVLGLAGIAALYLFRADELGFLLSLIWV